ncbi:dehydratase [Acinetobacter sp. 194]|uniref:MaoC/PaaZ C-terminal domain-containing protein n=1 Tax=Acinetobacter shaoyimingii TaxID=2715164 RepID=UPI00140948DE|nr:MaoC/PaaZ C-terminal domain-containing protein [Acinetobacter shaoyimingii]NHB57488.1 dehydratase [Acinetobacter shaoyimingii]
MLYLEDLTVGDQFKSREYEMTLAEVEEFAHKYDPQVFHIDAEATQTHPVFKKIVASAWHTSAVTMRLLTECFPIANGLIATESSLRWTRPANVGDRIHIEIEIVAITPSITKSDRGIVTYVSQARNQDGDVLLLATNKILVMKSNLGHGQS